MSRVPSLVWSVLEPRPARLLAAFVLIALAVVIAAVVWSIVAGPVDGPFLSPTRWLSVRWA